MIARRVLAVALSLAALAALSGGYLRSCTGPRPVVGASWAEPLEGGMRAVATIQNGGGEGDVQVTFRLTDAQGRTFTREESAQLEKGKPAEVSTWIPAPAGPYQLEVEAEYPPR
ncbi:MAG TPA: hypothetical protein VEB43_08440 [Anaeromyxobacter sp.]|nr:hypothetical protein [Anaeromyxobacter sp.]